MASMKITELTESNICTFCNNALATYCCPKCNQLYCSVPCYQCEKHQSCSETFYKSLVLENLENQSTEDKSKMKEILERDFHNRNLLPENEANEDDSDEETDSDDLANDIAERLAGIDLDNCEDVWQQLTDEERKDFEQFLLSGDVSKFVEMWTPWWDTNITSPIVDLDVLEDIKKKCPEISKDIKPFQQISVRPPAKCVEHNLVNVIGAYCFTMRYVNGEMKDFPKEVAKLIYKLSSNLNSNANFDNFNQAIGSVREQCINGKDLGIMVDEENLELIKSDVHCIMHGPHGTERKYYILTCLSHIKQLVNDGLQAPEAKNSPEGEFFQKFTAKQQSEFDKIDLKGLKLASKKVDYYLSFVNDVYSV